MSLTVVQQTCDQCKELRRPVVKLSIETAAREYEDYYFCSLICLENWVCARNMLTCPAAGSFR